MTQKTEQKINPIEQTPNSKEFGGFTLGAKERLKSKKAIEQIFTHGSAVSVFPLRLVYQDVPVAQAPMQCAFSVSKRHFKKAVDRNKIKRLIREAYRIQKPALYKTLPAPFIGMILFTGKEIPSQEIMNKNIVKLLEKWRKSISL
jgi:ribonuclease P protein component